MSEYKRPMLMTLEGNGFLQNYKNLEPENYAGAYYNQQFATLGGWGAFDFLRPSKLKKTAGAITAVSTALTVVPGLQAVMAPVAGAAAGVTAGATLIHNVYARKGPSGEVEYYSDAQGKNPIPAGNIQTKKKSPIVPIVIGAVGILAALGIAA
jgi:hypothetical protein